MTKEEYIKRAKSVKENWIDARFEKYINYIVDQGIVNLDEVPGNYKAVYPALAAYLEKVASDMIRGSSYEKERRRQRRAANIIKRSFGFSMMY